MTDKELHRMKRSELLELLLVQQEELDRLKQELAETRAGLEDRNLRLEASGSIAEAALAVTSIFEQAQKAADLYLENIKIAAGETPAPAEEPSGESAAEEVPAAPKPRKRKRRRSGDES